jgi:hypothetical protein
MCLWRILDCSGDVSEKSDNRTDSRFLESDLWERSVAMVEARRTTS